MVTERAQAPEAPERWSAKAKTDVVLRVRRGEAIDAVSREVQGPAHEIETWRRQFELALDDYFVVNESMARTAWPGQDPIGHHVRVVSDSIDRFWTVVGVVADDRFNDLAAPPTPTTYFPGRQEEPDDPWLVVRTHDDPEHAVKLVGQARLRPWTRCSLCV